MISVTASERTAFVAALIAASLLAAAPARADASAADKAAAEALFEHAKLLMKDARYGEACAKFQESQRIDPGIGTTLYLADCFEKNGQSASAWAEFLEAAAAARGVGQADREKKARERAAALETKLNRLSITVAAGAEVPGLEVKRDGAPIAKALWGTPVPLDPGEHTVSASAPGKKPWATKITLDAAHLAPVVLSIPVLEDAPAPPPPKVEPPKVEPPKAGPSNAARPLQSGPIVTTRDTMPPVRIVGGTLLGVGIASAAVGGILGAVTLLKKSGAAEGCHDNGVCGKSGADDINAARGLATGANVTLIAGGTAFLAGVIILAVTSPAPTERKQVIRVQPLVGAGTAGLGIGGRF